MEIEISKSDAKNVLPLIIIYIMSSPFLFIYIVIHSLSFKDEYYSSIYQCEKNINVYVYSRGAMSSFEYAIGKEYEFFSVDDIINVSYSKKEDIDDDTFHEVLEKYNCSLVGD